VCQLAEHVQDSPKQFSDRHTRVEGSKHGVRLQLHPQTEQLNSERLSVRPLPVEAMCFPYESYLALPKDPDQMII